MSPPRHIMTSSVSTHWYLSALHTSWAELAPWQKRNTNTELVTMKHTLDNHHPASKQMFGASAHRLFIQSFLSVIELLSRPISFGWIFLILCSAVRLNTAHDKHSCDRGGDMERVQILQSCDLPLYSELFHDVPPDVQSAGGKEPLKTN